MHAVQRLVLNLILALTGLAAVPTARAQSEEWKLGAFGGVYLPGSVPGVFDIMKGGGVRGAWFAEIFGVEVFGFRSIEDGAIVNIAGGTLVAGFDVPGMKEVTTLAYAGFQGVFNRGLTRSGSQRDYTDSGIHMGGGFLVEMSPSLNFRWASTIYNGPGRSVLMEVGFEWVLGGRAIESRR